MTVRVAGPPPDRPRPGFDRRLFEARAGTLLQELGHAASELSVSLVSDEEMAAMNGRYRGVDRPTDVLSFSLLEGDHAEFHGDLLGEVVIDVEFAARQAASLAHSLDSEMTRLLIHGTLHLLGYDHQEEDDARTMEALEETLWEALRR